MALQDRYINPTSEFGFMRVSEAELEKYTPEERKEYEQSQRAYNDIKIAVDTAKKEGRNEGIAQGIAQGRAEGKAEGERDKAIKIAIAMKKDGMPANIISKYTGLDETEIGIL